MDELQNLENLLNLLLGALETLFSSGEEISDELQGLVAQELSWLQGRIQRLKTPGAPQVPELPGAPFPSSNIHAFRYDPKSQNLFIKFQDKYPKTNGPVYLYKNIPEFIYNVFSRGAVAPKTSGRNRWHRWQRGVTPSLGASAYALIRSGGYPYQRVS